MWWPVISNVSTFLKIFSIGVHSTYKIHPWKKLNIYHHSYQSLKKQLCILSEYTDVWILLSVGNWKANMKVIILVTFALLATLNLVSSTSICPDEKSFPCTGDERYVEYVLPKDKLTRKGKCPHRATKINKLKAKEHMVLASKSMACQSKLPVIFS